MRKRIEMDDKDFIKNARNFAKQGYSLRQAALDADVSVQTYRNHLFDVAMRLQEAPPAFSKGKRARMKEHISEVRSSGQGGNGRRLALPNEIFVVMDWSVGTKVKIKKFGKKVILESYEGPEESSVDSDENSDS